MRQNDAAALIARCAIAPLTMKTPFDLLEPSQTLPRRIRTTRIFASVHRAATYLLVGATVAWLASPPCGAYEDRIARFSCKASADGVDFLEHGQLVTRYEFQSGSKPVLWPLIGPDGVRMSREYPMNPAVASEEHDHVHHRSLWMTYGDVDGVDYWAEGADKGRVRHQRILALNSSEDEASVIAEHHWIPPNQSEPKLIELCRYRIAGSSDERIIDCEYFLIPYHSETQARDGSSMAPIRFGDTKEGMFAIRVPESIRTDKTEGTILNEHGQKNAEAWGRPSRWVDYAGFISTTQTSAASDNQYGIAILIHPKSFRNDGFWHVRTYGLFAHNPLGVKDFMEGRNSATENGTASNKLEGGFVLKHDDSMHLFYRVVLHRGRWNVEQAQTRYAEFEKATPVLQKDLIRAHR